MTGRKWDVGDSRSQRDANVIKDGKVIFDKEKVLMRLLNVFLLMMVMLPYWGGLLGTGVAEGAEAKPPNVVMIISDDQSWTDYSFMGHKVIKTPHLDKLATQSLVFRRGYVPSSLCRPSLVTMVTGLYPHQHKITGNDPPLPKGGRRGPGQKKFLAQRQEMINYIDKVPTLPKLLKAKGYLSHQSGKWWEGHYSRGGFTHGMTHGDPKRGGRHGDVGLKIGRKGLGEITGFIEHAMKEQKPFFIWYAPFLPHTPHNPPKRLLDKYRDKVDSIHVARYYAMCEWFDETCGQLLGYLDKKGLTKDTLVLYVTDNGWIQSKKAQRYAPKSKRSQYDGGLRTPIMVRWPGKVKVGESDGFAMSIDLAPTILKAAGLSSTREMEGIDLLDMKAVKGRKRIFGEVFLHNSVDIHSPASSLQYRWVIERNDKLIVANPRNVLPKNNQAGYVELYDLAKDAHETKNLAKNRADRVKELRKKLDTWWDGKRP